MLRYLPILLIMCILGCSESKKFKVIEKNSKGQITNTWVIKGIRPRVKDDGQTLYDGLSEQVLSWESSGTRPIEAQPNHFLRVISLSEENENKIEKNNSSIIITKDDKLDLKIFKVYELFPDGCTGKEWLIKGYKPETTSSGKGLVETCVSNFRPRWQFDCGGDDVISADSTAILVIEEYNKDITKSIDYELGYRQGLADSKNKDDK